MTLKNAKKIFNEITELCQEIGDDNLSSTLEHLYRDAQEATEIEEVINAARELMVFVGEVPWSDSELDGTLSEIEELYNLLLEDDDSE